MSLSDLGGLVYSTEHGKMCSGCGNPQNQCTCSEQVLPETDGVVRVGRETKGRKGQGVTVITGIPMVGDELKKFVKKLKARCGSGGTIKNGVVEIQGDHRDLLVQELSKEGWSVKRSGG